MVIKTKIIWRNKMRKILHSKIHRATITDANLNYVGSISIDETLIKESGLVNYEEVQVVDITNGARFYTYVIPAEKDSGIIQINGAAAHLVSKGDIIIIMAYKYISEDKIQSLKQKIIFVDQNNKIIERTQQEQIAKYN